jgi:hypothetical protein
MHPERVVIAKVSAVVTAVVVSTAVGAFRSLLLGHLFPIAQVIVFPIGGRPRAQATIIGIVAPPIFLRIGRHLLVILSLHALDARQPSNGSRDLLLLDGVARCDSFGRDTPSAMDAGGPLDLQR